MIMKDYHTVQIRINYGLILHSIFIHDKYYENNVLQTLANFVLFPYLYYAAS